MKIFAGLFLLSLLPSCAVAAPLSEGPASLSYVLNNATTVYSNVKDFNWAIRIYRVVSPGECFGVDPACPKEILYLAISDITAAPNQKLFVTSPAYQWDIESVMENGAELKPDGCIEISLKEKVIDPTSKNWKYVEHKFCVNTGKNIEEKKQDSK